MNVLGPLDWLIDSCCKIHMPLDGSIDVRSEVRLLAHLEDAVEVSEA